MLLGALSACASSIALGAVAMCIYLSRAVLTPHYANPSFFFFEHHHRWVVLIRRRRYRHHMIEGMCINQSINQSIDRSTNQSSIHHPSLPTGLLAARHGPKHPSVKEPLRALQDLLEPLDPERIQAGKR